MLLFYEFYCNRLQRIDKNNLDQINDIFIVIDDCFIFFIIIESKIFGIRSL